MKQAKEKKLNPQLIDNLEKKLIQVEAQLRFVGEDAEAALKQKDEDLRAKLPGQTNGKKRKTTNRRLIPKIILPRTISNKMTFKILTFHLELW